MEAEVNGERHKIGTWDAGHILGPDLVASCRVHSFCANSSDCTLKICVLVYMIYISVKGFSKK